MAHAKPLWNIMFLSNGTKRRKNVVRSALSVLRHTHTRINAQFKRIGAAAARANGNPRWKEKKNSLEKSLVSFFGTISITKANGAGQIISFATEFIEIKAFSSQTKLRDNPFQK